jgi:3-mercaptopyruvate sulfurtransferase SseA
MTDDLVKRLRAEKLPGDRQHQYEARITLWAERQEAADRIEELEAALREKDNIDYIIDSHGISHNTFTIVYGKK